MRAPLSPRRRAAAGVLAVVTIALAVAALLWSHGEDEPVTFSTTSEQIQVDFQAFLSSLLTGSEGLQDAPDDVRFQQALMYVAAATPSDRSKAASVLSQLSSQNVLKSKLPATFAKTKDIKVSKNGLSATWDIPDSLANDPLVVALPGAKKSGVVKFVKGGTFWALDGPNFNLPSMAKYAGGATGPKPTT